MREMSIGENYEGNITPILSEISRGTLCLRNVSRENRRLLIRAYSLEPPYHPTTYPPGRTEQSHVPAGHSPP